MAKVLVTGGAGYVGSHTVDLLVQRGYDVVVLDNLYMGHQAALPKQVTFAQGDLLDRAFLENVFQSHQFEGIFHFASHTMVGESTQKPWLYLRDNIVASSYLLEAAVQYDVKRFILSSTSNLFGEPERIPIGHQERVIPGSPYGESKAVIERQLHWMHELYGLRYCALRYFNAAGAHPNGHIGEDHTPETHLIPVVLQVALGQRDHVTIFGTDYPTPDGTCIRDYVHVMDLAQAHLLAYEALSDVPFRHYNLGNGDGYSVKQLIETARYVTEHSIPIIEGERRQGDPAILVADSKAIKDELGWKPDFPDLTSIIGTAWAWHKLHPQGYSTPKTLDK